MPIQLLLRLASYTAAALVFASCTTREFSPPAGDEGGAGSGGASGGTGSSAGGSPEATGGMAGGNLGGSTTGGVDGSGGGTEACIPETKECVDETTLRTCDGESDWRYDECVSCVDGACSKTLTLCADGDGPNSAANELNVTCQGVTVEVSFASAPADPDGCRATVQTPCVAGEPVSVSFSGPTTFRPDGIFVGSSSTNGVLCSSGYTCTTTMPNGPLFVRGLICFEDIC